MQTASILLALVPSRDPCLLHRQLLTWCQFNLEYTHAYQGNGYGEQVMCSVVFALNIIMPSYEHDADINAYVHIYGGGQKYPTRVCRTFCSYDET